MPGKISIVIPTFNEAACIGKLVSYLQEHGGENVKEIIISDGGSADETVTLAEQAGATVLISPNKGRAAQMNYGAINASAGILYFVHADSFPPVDFAADILKAVNDDYDFGRYRTKFDSNKFLLKINAWFSRFNRFICYGGDQTLFITRELFERSGGFKNELLIMEEYEFAERLMKLGKYKIFKHAALVSARKYDDRSWFRVQLAHHKVVHLFKKGVDQEKIVRIYKAILK